MTDIFISYKREDESRVTTIAEGLRQAGLSVWLDLETPGGANWRQSIAEQLNAARCVLVVWSEASVNPTGEFVHDEAARARDRGVLLPVRIDAVSPPLGFGEIQSLDLVGWRGNPGDKKFQDVIAAAKAIVAGEPRPRPKAPGRKKRMAAFSAGAATLAVIAAFTLDVADMQKAICRAPGVDRVCGAFGVATRAERQLWESRPPGDCRTLRTYLERFPHGAYAQEAERLLQAASNENRESWTAEERPLPLTVRQGLDPLGNESAARQDALARGLGEARRLICNGFNEGEYRLVDATVDAQEWRCERRGDGFVCGFDGQAICQVQVRRVDRVEVCP